MSTLYLSCTLYIGNFLHCGVDICVLQLHWSGMQVFSNMQVCVMCSCCLCWFQFCQIFIGITWNHIELWTIFCDSLHLERRLREITYLTLLASGSCRSFNIQIHMLLYCSASLMVTAEWYMPLGFLLNFSPLNETLNLRPQIFDSSALGKGVELFNHYALIIFKGI